MTKNDFIYALKASGCLYHNEQTYYEENELIRTFEDMEMFEEEKSLKDMTKLEHAIKHIKTRADAWAVKEVTEALQSISERLDKALSQEPIYCDRNICLSNEYNGIGCDECIVNKAEQEPCTDAVSREAVIKAITNTSGIRGDALNALYALPSVNPQPCDDAISREDALKLIYDFKENHTKDREKHPINYGTLLDLIRLIRELPSVTQKSGKWIDHSDEGYVECPFCGHATTCEDNIDELHYCFYCGARMESEE